MHMYENDKTSILFQRLWFNMASRQKSGTSLGSGSGCSTPTSENSEDNNVQQKQSAPDSPPLPSINERLGKAVASEMLSFSLISGWVPGAKTAPTQLSEPFLPPEVQMYSSNVYLQIA